VEQVHATTRAFAAISSDGRIMAWGSPEHGSLVEFVA